MSDTDPSAVVGPPDADLVAWREAVVTGGLPRPHRRDRWQVLRAGVAGLWEFDQAEYWYADGWVQLTGRNETGKSSLMALTTLIPWLADTSPQNIDTLGNSGKRFRYYVEPTDQDGDRRDAGASTNRGWLWVEYGRLTDAGSPEFFTTLGFAEARRSNTGSLPLTWCTCAGGARVGDGLQLVVSRAVRSPKDLSGCDGFEPHTSGATFKTRVGRDLLGTNVDRLETVGNMLRVTRTPKIGEQMREGFITERLQGSLPALERHEVSKLAEGWDQLDRLRQDLDVAASSVEATKRFITTAWVPYVQARVRQTADVAASARSAFDTVTRRAREAREALEASQSRVQALEERRTDTETSILDARHSREQLVRSAAYQDAATRLVNAENAERTARLRQESAQLAVAAADRAILAADAAREDSATRSETLSQRVAELTSIVDQLGHEMRGAGLRVDDERDWPSLDQSVSGRRQALRILDSLAEALATAEVKAAGDDDQAARDADRAEVSRQESEDALSQAESERDDVAIRLAKWAEAHEAASLVDAWVAGLPVDVNPTARLRDAVRADWFEPRLDIERQTLISVRHERDQLGLEREAVLVEIRRVEAETAPTVPEPMLWRRRSRPEAGHDGAPLWALVDPVESLDPSVLASIEAALGAMGLLDAWVTPDGVYASERDGADIVLAISSDAKNTVPQNLSLVLRSVDGPLQDTVDNVLGRVAWNGSGPLEGGLSVGADGRWRLDALAGRALPRHGTAELIGEAARAAARRRRLEELRSRASDLKTHISALDGSIAELEARIAKLHDAFASAPDDDRLREFLASVQELDRRADRDRQAAAQSSSRAAESKEKADAARGEMYEHAGRHSLPVLRDDRIRCGDHLITAATLVVTARHADKARVGAERDLSTARARLGVAEESAAEAASFAQAAQGAADREERAARMLRAELDRDTRGILEQAEELAGQLSRLESEAKVFVQELIQATQDAATVQEVLNQTEAERERCAQDRDASFREFSRLLDAGLVAQLAIDLPYPELRTVEATRDQVAALRSQIEPRGWPSSREDQESFVTDRKWRLRDRLDDLQPHLRRGGRDSHVDLAPDPAYVRIIVDSTGTVLEPRQALIRLEEIHRQAHEAYDASMRETLEELLGSTFIDHLRERLNETHSLVARINKVLAEHPTGTSRTMLRIDLDPAAGATSAVLAALRGEGGRALLDPNVAGHVREFLRSRIEEARDEGDTDLDWEERLAQSLDYRTWYDVHLKKRVGVAGKWSPLTGRTFSNLSGGARVVMLLLPFVATLTALYDAMDGAPRPLWLDEAFDGLDATNRATVLDLFNEFDLDVLVAGPGRLLNSPSVPAAAIYQVVRAEDPYPGADLTVELWASGELTPLELPVDSTVGLSRSDDTDQAGLFD